MQIHLVPKRNVREVLRRINAAGLTTKAACGDVRHNVMCCPAPYWGDPVHGEMRALAFRLSEELCPRMSAYREIWLAEPGAAGGHGRSPASDEEPLYGKTYLPRKFKVAVGLPGDNCVDLYRHDVGLMALCKDFRITGYNVLVGGGMGAMPGRQDPLPAHARGLALAGADQVVDVVKAILRVFRDFGNRTDRQRGRLRHLLADWGIEKFKTQVESELGYVLPAPPSDEVWDIDDHLGWHEQGDGRWFYGVHVASGRIQDSNDLRLKSALREICRKYQPTVTFTPGQNLLLGDVRWEDRAGIEDFLRRHDVRREFELSGVRRWSNACVAMPTCPKAVTEAERVLPGVLDLLEAELGRLGLGQEMFAVRMTGCDLGCVQPYTADIGLVGRAAGRYAIYLGGRRLGNRLGFLYREGVPRERIVETLVPLFVLFRDHRHTGESFGDFCHRIEGEGWAAVAPE